MKKIALVLAVVISTSLGGITAHADAYNATGDGSPDGTMIAAITESAEYASVSRRIVHSTTSEGLPSDYLCSNGVEATGNCSLDANQAFFYSNSVLPYCESISQNDCIEAVSFGTSEDTQLKNAKFVRQIAGQTYPEITIPSFLYKAGTVSVWEMDGLPHSQGGIKYAVQVNAEASFDPNNKKFNTFGVSASIIPISDRAGAGYITSNLQQGEEAVPSGKRGTIGGWGMTAGCAFTEENYCAAIQDFTEGSKFSLTIRASNQITGWFKGRIQKPQVSITKFSETNNKITMTAEPVAVPRLAALVTPENTTARGKELLEASMISGKRELFKGETLRNTNPDNGVALEWVEEFRAAAKDTAAGISTLWTFATLAGGEENHPCFTDKSRVIGVVTTNATALSRGTPEFSKNMLTYKVAGLHYAPDGKTLNEGTYDLVMRSDVARCLYGFSKAPISATVSVVGEGGENKVATTVVREKDGWLQLAAYGFTFSSPTISVKLTQAAPKKTTITCVKGKVTKKVTAAAPKCPTGYKKK
jgi:hypothetical protein